MSTSSEVIANPPIPLGIGKREAFGPSPVLALVLAILVALAVFGFIWRIRKTFGMKGE